MNFELIISILVAVVFILLFTILVVAEVYKNKVEKLKKQNRNLRSNILVLRRRNNELCDLLGKKDIEIERW